MAELKTTPTKRSVTTFLNTIDDERKRRDAFALRDRHSQPESLLNEGPR